MCSQGITADKAMETQPAAEQIYIACSVEDLIAVEMDAWSQGYNRAGTDGAQMLREVAAVERVAEDACDAALLIYVPMNVPRFHDVYIRAWCGGYCMHLHERDRR